MDADTLRQPHRDGRYFTLLFQRWEQDGGANLPSIADRLLNDRAFGSTAVLARCGSAIARAVDAWKGHPYHSATHHAEVAVIADFLAEEAERDLPLSNHSRALLLCAALAHDYGFEPGAPRKPFSMEARSAAWAVQTMRGAGASEADCRAVEALILATEPTARETVRALADGRPVEGVPVELSALAGSPELARLAAMLSDADLIPSAGLSEDWSKIQTARLSSELGFEITSDGFLSFLQNVVGPEFASAEGRVFDQNLQALVNSHTQPPGLTP